MQKFRDALILFLITGFLFSLLTAESPQALASGKINGKLTAKDSSALKNTKIVLNLIAGNETTALAETLPDENGNYLFENLEANRSYAVHVNYKGIEYSNNVALKDGEKAEINFALYEVVQGDNGTEIEMHHIIIVPGEGMLDVTEYLFYKNAGEEAINTTKLYISLPIERKATATSLMECCFTQYSDYATFDPMQPLKPGDISEVALNYKIPINSSEIMFERKIKYPTKELWMLAAQRNGSLGEAAALVLPQGETTIEGESYQAFYAQNLEKDSMPKIKFANLKMLAPEIVNAAGENQFYTTSNALFLIGISLMLIGIVYYLKFKR